MRILQWILALVFAATAGLKVATSHSPGMAQTMFGGLPPLLQWFLVAGELLLATWLASNWKPRWSSFATITLISIFMSAVIVEITKPVPHSCGCFGAFTPTQSTRGSLGITLAMDTVLLLGAFGCYFHTLRTINTPHQTPSQM
jgi:peptidoglycan/LPS O-acetylase OafA/YrhL